MDEIESGPEGKRYYSYILCYVDDILVIDHDAMTVLGEINRFLPLKPDSVGDPSIYLGAKLSTVEMSDDDGRPVTAWAMSLSKYVQESVCNCEKHLAEVMKKKWSLPKQAPNPFTTDYEPELDVSPVL